MSTESTYRPIKLSDGNEAPGIAFGIGTAWFGSECVDVVKTALAAGFKHLDLAQAYKNSASVGKALKETRTDRETLYITTKAGSGMKDVRQALDEELEAIGTDYVNSFLLHWPYDFVKDGYPSMEEAWRGMIDLKKSGKAKSIGVSNFRVRDLQKLIDSKPEELPSINQIEYHPFVYEASEELYQFCTKHGIRLAAYGPTCPITKFSGGPFDAVLEQVTEAISARHGDQVTTSQVLLKLASQRALVVTTSGKDWRMKEQLAAGALPDLTEQEVKRLTDAAKPHSRGFMKHMDDKETEY
ncbi:hypothetical protein JCM3766R1_006882 [Sporobolomyces carnicolor]